MTSQRGYAEMERSKVNDDVVHTRKVTYNEPLAKDKEALNNNKYKMWPVVGS